MRDVEAVVRPLSEKFRRGKLAFLVGAGISADPPSCLPLAWGLVERLVDSVTTRADLRHELRSRLRPVRLERILSLVPRKVQHHCLQALQSEHPNQNHYALAKALAHGCVVLTTNFDTLIEAAAGDAKPFVYSHWKQLSELKRHGIRGSLIKLHGSLDTVVGDSPFTISRIGDLVQGLPAESAEILSEVLESYPIVVLGYSGADDFDLYPWLMEHRCQSGLYWLRHGKRQARLSAVSEAPDDHAGQIVNAQQGCHMEGSTAVFLAALAGTERWQPPTRKPPTLARAESNLSESMRFLARGWLAKSVGLTEIARLAFEGALPSLGLDVTISAREEKYAAAWLTVPSGLRTEAEQAEPVDALYAAVCESAQLRMRAGDLEVAWQLLQAGLRRAREDLAAGRNLPSIAALLLECARFAYNDETVFLTPYGPSHFVARALEICDAAGDGDGRLVKIEVLAQKAEWRRNVSDYSTATQCLGEAIMLCVRERQFEKAWARRCDLALVLMDSGRYEEALDTYQQALEFFRVGGASNIVALIRGNVGSCLAGLGRTDDAIRALEQSVEEIHTLRVLPESELYPTYRRLAMLYWNEHRDRTKALELLDCALRSMALAAPSYAIKGKLTLPMLWVAKAQEAIASGRDIEPPE